MRRPSTLIPALVAAFATLCPSQSDADQSISDARTHTDSVASYMRTRHYGRALRLLAARHTGEPPASDLVRIALCLLHTGEPRAADSLLARADLNGDRSSYRDYWRARATFEMGDRDRAARSFDLLAEHARPPVKDSAAVWSLHAALADRDSVLATKAIRRLTQLDDDLAAVGLHARMRTDDERWESAWLTILVHHRGEPAAGPAAYLADSLGWRAAGESWIWLARLHEEQGAVPLAADAWNGAIADASIPARHGYARYRAARLLVNNRDYRNAAPLLASLLDDSSHAYWWPRALRLSARLERRRDRETRSRQIEREFVERYPQHDDVPDAMWQIGMSFERTRRLDDAVGAYEALARAFPTHELGEAARWRAGFVLYRQGDYSGAHRRFAKLAREAGDWLVKDQAGFWAGKSLYTNGRYEDARLAWDAVAAFSPRSYYAVVSAVAVNRPAVPPEDEQPPSDSNTRAHEDWPGFDEASWLTSLGEWRWARDVLSLRTRGLARTVSEKERLADAFEAIGDYSMALRWRWRAMWSRITEDRYHELPPDILRRIWPNFYAGQVREAAREHDIDPALLWAVIRQESVFDSDVTSSANARGLMQIIPSTGRALARRLRVDDFDSDDLYEPGLNIRLGARYVNDLLDRFDSKVDFMAAGYNAGPSNVSRWRRSAGGDHDLYREMITYAETRKYVKLVLKNYLIYRELYPDRSSP